MERQVVPGLKLDFFRYRAGRLEAFCLPPQGHEAAPPEQCSGGCSCHISLFRTPPAA